MSLWGRRAIAELGVFWGSADDGVDRAGGGGGRGAEGQEGTRLRMGGRLLMELGTWWNEAVQELGIAHEGCRRLSERYGAQMKGSREILRLVKGSRRAGTHHAGAMGI